MVPIVRQVVTREGIELEKRGGEVWPLARDQVLAMRAAMPRPQVIAAVRESLGGFLEIDPAELTNRVLFNALDTGEMSLDFVHGDI